MREGADHSSHRSNKSFTNMSFKIFIGRPPLLENTPSSPQRYLRGGPSTPRWSLVCSVVRWQCFAMSSLRVSHANCSIIGCKNQHKCLYSVPATEEQKRQWLRFISNDNVPAAVCVSLCVCVLTTSHRTASVTRVSIKLALPRHWPS